MGQLKVYAHSFSGVQQRAFHSNESPQKISIHLFSGAWQGACINEWVG